MPGFYDDVRPLSEAERAEWKKLPFNDTRYRKELGAPKLWGEKGYSTLERVWARPTFEVNGLLSGFTGEGAKTVLPAVAMAKVSMRLVPDQDPKKIGDLFEAHVSKVTPKTVELKVTRMHGGKPWMTEFDNSSPRRRPGHREGVRQGPRSSPGRRIIPVVPTSRRTCPGGGLFASAADEKQTRLTRSSISGTSRRRHRLGVPYEEIAALDRETS